MESLHTRDFALRLVSEGDKIIAGNKIGGTELASILLQLSELEIDAGGPYGIAGTNSDKQADIGFNLAIAYFLNACDVELPKLNAFLRSAIAYRTHSSVLPPALLRKLSADFERKWEYETPRTSSVDLTPEEAEAMKHIRNEANRRFRTLSPALRGNAELVMEKTIRGNTDKQMSLMPLFMRQGFGRNGKKFSDKEIAEFGLANVFFWSAFIVYDDFWDEDEAALPKLLPVANVFARHYASFFSRADFLEKEKDRKSFSQFFHDRMDKLDAANTWEISTCRLKKDGSRLLIPESLPEYGDYSIKYYPAAGHILGPIAMLMRLGFGLRSPEASHLEAYFKHYLIAMQLNDDAHDWREDLVRGHVSTAVFLILKKWLEAHPESRAIDLAADLREIERIFWFEAIEPLCQSILKHTRLSRAALKKLECVEDKKPLEQFIEKNESAALTALDEHQNSVDFLMRLKKT